MTSFSAVFVFLTPKSVNNIIQLVWNPTKTLQQKQGWCPKLGWKQGWVPGMGHEDYSKTLVWYFFFSNAVLTF
jgi:hypothetical protein